MRAATTCLGLALACALPVPALAQEDATERRAAVVDIPLVERTRIFVNIPRDKTGEIYEGWLAIHFPLGGRMQESYTAAFRRGAGGADWVWLPSLSMTVNLRQTREASAPVRTPSYMPRFRYTGVRTTTPSSKTSTQWIVDGTVGHYSNGQDGCLFEGQDHGNDCQFAQPVADRDLVVNKRDGSFSSHYVEVGIAHRWIQWSAVPNANSRTGAHRITTVFTRVRDYQLLSGVPGGMTDELGRLYGTKRFRVGAERVQELLGGGAWKGPVWFGGWAEVSSGEAPGVSAIRGALELGKTFDGLNGTGVFARWYSGHDDYNLGFMQPINVLQIGITLGGERRPSWGR